MTVRMGHNSQSWFWKAAFLLKAAMVAGCVAPSSIRLEQPRVPAAQRQLDLLSQQVYWMDGEGVYRVLAEIPLPGAQTGRPMYLLYLRLTMKPAAGERGPVRPAEACGFLIQTRGPLTGLAMVSEAAIDAAPPGAGQACWRLHVDLACDDGTRISGSLLAQREAWRVTRFEGRTNAADVQVLLQSPAPMMKSGSGQR